MAKDDERLLIIIMLADEELLIVVTAADEDTLAPETIVETCTLIVLLLAASAEDTLVITGIVAIDVLDEAELDVVRVVARLEPEETDIVDKLEVDAVDVIRLDAAMLEVAELVLDVVAGLLMLMLAAEEVDARDGELIMIVLIGPEAEEAVEKMTIELDDEDVLVTTAALLLVVL
ncbi:hypothetical protein B0A55_08281 [Friedmanniomyces simplex]|uniref:Uncharacterized protein n=1 Tax=Friedmanniomyces simplex TaxID=329884 RepID=A0A4U0WT49_9PEZI|nr:hypothetical protein B0A55_08281 [Friedmanniomyces simplex]